MIQYFPSSTTLKDKITEARKRIGSRIRVLRKGNGGRLKQLASDLGISYSQISRIENGKSDIKASMIPVLAEKYGVLAESFFNDDGKAYPDMILKLVRSAGYEKSEERLMHYMEYQMNHLIDSGDAWDFLSVLLFMLQSWGQYDDPIGYLDGRLSQAKERVAIYEGDIVIREGRKDGK